jgi:hypothetical protein
LSYPTDGRTHPPEIAEMKIVIVKESGKFPEIDTGEGKETGLRPTIENDVTDNEYRLRHANNQNDQLPVWRRRSIDSHNNSAYRSQLA